MAVFDDGTGPALYVGGDFITAGGQAANGVAKWNGMSWSPLGSGLGHSGDFPSVESMATSTPPALV